MLCRHIASHTALPRRMRRTFSCLGSCAAGCNGSRCGWFELMLCRHVTSHSDVLPSPSGGQLERRVAHADAPGGPAAGALRRRVREARPGFKKGTSN